MSLSDSPALKDDRYYTARMRLVYFGSGAFGLPTLRALVQAHEVALVVSQPDRPAGRNRQPTATPISTFAAGARLPLICPENVNEPAVVEQIHSAGADAFVAIAFGQKLGRALLRDRLAVNLHASLLPKYRGAAPINWAIMNGESVTGLSVIALADRMDAGDVLGQVVTPIDPMETAGELHDRLAELGPGLVLEVLRRHDEGALPRQQQEESRVTLAPKLRKEDGTVSFDAPAERVRGRVHGLTPWPGCRVRLGDGTLRLHRVQVVSRDERRSERPGTIADGDRVVCAPGMVRLLAVHPPGGKMMSFSAYRAGHAIAEGARIEPMEEAQ